MHDIDDEIKIDDFDISDDYNGTRNEYNSSVRYEYSSLRVSFAFMTENNL